MKVIFGVIFNEDIIIRFITSSSSTSFGILFEVKIMMRSTLWNSTVNLFDFYIEWNSMINK